MFQNTFAMFVGHGIRVVLQSLYFILIARGLGSDSYGAFLSVASFTSILAPFASWGSGHILIKHTARDRAAFPVYWGNSLLITFILSLFITIFISLFAEFFFVTQISLKIIIEIALADLLFARILDLCSQAFQGFENLKLTAFIQVLANLFRFLAIFILTISKLPLTVEIWTDFYLVGSAISCLLSVIIVTSKLGRPKFSFQELLKEFKEGLYFSISVSAQNIYNDIDKMMLAKMSTLSSAGIYGAAYRIVDVSFVPVRSLLAATYSKFFQEGHKSGLQGNLTLTKKLLIAPLAYSLIAALIMCITAPLLKYILGSSFEKSILALQLLCIIPLLKTLHHFAADSLSGAGFQNLRSLIQILIAAINVLANLWLISKYSWIGAVISSLICDALLVIFLWSLVFILSRKQFISKKGVV